MLQLYLHLIEDTKLYIEMYDNVMTILKSVSKNFSIHYPYYT